MKQLPWTLCVLALALVAWLALAVVSLHVGKRTVAHAGAVFAVPMS